MTGHSSRRLRQDIFVCRETGSRQLTGSGETPGRNTKIQEKGGRTTGSEEEGKREKGEEEGKNKFGKRPALIRDKIRQDTQNKTNLGNFFFCFLIYGALFSS